ncbi:hypothetical protein M0R88_00060 [Halorussus gelatinilyticus]|uniref:Holin-X, holin superfamily III n=1 Tax=Halorussus gelatinilyticus TaxID=2937524 RepID=A0A8U0IJU0_9EURY|nr:hypothetical protein [Halorussus gelatinilyticus]UPW00514.1 hypothetical protein M0R88_00060 [Halorussus gelatinilyticus]
MSESHRPPGSGPGESRRSAARRRQSVDSGSDQRLAPEEKLLALYENLRAEIRVRIRVANVRATRGIAVVGGVVGSAMVQSSFHLLALVPVVFGVRIDAGLLSVVTVALSAFLLAVGLSHLAYRRRLSREIRAGERP